MEQPPQKEKNPLDAFREDMRGLKEAETKKKEAWEKRGHKGEAYDPHFDDILPELLSDKDRVVWEKIKNQTLTRAELETYRQELAEDVKAASPEERKSRGTFRAMVVNKAVFIVQQEWAKLKHGSKKPQ